MRSAALLAAATAALLAGCSFGSYGDRGGQIGDKVPKFITPGKTREIEVLAKLGEPDATAISGAEQVLFYKAAHGWYVGFIGRQIREDLVLRAENGVIMAAEARRIGDSTGIALPPFGDHR